jgi:hypothetical protein
MNNNIIHVRLNKRFFYLRKYAVVYKVIVLSLFDEGRYSDLIFTKHPTLKPSSVHTFNAHVIILERYLIDS